MVMLVSVGSCECLCREIVRRAPPRKPEQIDGEEMALCQLGSRQPGRVDVAATIQRIRRPTARYTRDHAYKYTVSQRDTIV